ncbi:hypothetical protein B0H10DRAFT_1942781 [Mycena sp. CBHHK59/15]|nr:hypothetical protein B0H10DRAFT_1942781 [Mycena sp. CBHHK59/15]
MYQDLVPSSAVMGATHPTPISAPTFSVEGEMPALSRQLLPYELVEGSRLSQQKAACPLHERLPDVEADAALKLAMRDAELERGDELEASGDEEAGELEAEAERDTEAELTRDAADAELLYELLAWEADDEGLRDDVFDVDPEWEAALLLKRDADAECDADAELELDADVEADEREVEEGGTPMLMRNC